MCTFDVFSVVNSAKSACAHTQAHSIQTSLHHARSVRYARSVTQHAHTFASCVSVYCTKAFLLLDL